jgi:hypothetical protein
MSWFSAKQEEKSIEGIVLRAGTTKDPSMRPSYLTLLLDSDRDMLFRMQSWCYPLEVSGTKPGDRVTITYTVDREGAPKVQTFVNHSYRLEVGKDGDAIAFN